MVVQDPPCARAPRRSRERLPASIGLGYYAHGSWARATAAAARRAPSSARREARDADLDLPLHRACEADQGERLRRADRAVEAVGVLLQPAEGAYSVSHSVRAGVARGGVACSSRAQARTSSACRGCTCGCAGTCAPRAASREAATRCPGSCRSSARSGGSWWPATFHVVRSSPSVRRRAPWPDDAQSTRGHGRAVASAPDRPFPDATLT